MDPVMNDFDHDDPKFLEAIFRVLLAENQREDDSKDSCVSALPIGKLAWEFLLLALLHTVLLVSVQEYGSHQQVERSDEQPHSDQEPLA